MQSLAEKIGEAFQQKGSKLDTIKEKSEHSPVICSSFEAGKKLKDKKKILLLTGAGISAGSKIPTYWGESTSIWEQKYKYCKTPQEMATRTFFEEHPEVKWQWTYEFLELVQKNKPNKGHYALYELQ